MKVLQCYDVMTSYISLHSRETPALNNTFSDFSSTTLSENTLVVITDISITRGFLHRQCRYPDEEDINSNMENVKFDVLLNKIGKICYDLSRVRC